MMTRRLFGLGALATAAGGAAVWLNQRHAIAATPGEKVFEVTHSEAEWQQILTPEQFYVLRRHGTERAGTSPLEFEHRAASFTAPGAICRCTRQRPNSSPGRAGRVSPHRSSTRSRRRKIRRGSCPGQRCIAGAAAAISAMSSPTAPPPTGLRYCMNGVAMTFKPGETSAAS